MLQYGGVHVRFGIMVFSEYIEYKQICWKALILSKGLISKLKWKILEYELIWAQELDLVLNHHHGERLCVMLELREAKRGYPMSKVRSSG